jgi:glycosyltransferase involved in cell wall biosynthesis
MRLLITTQKLDKYDPILGFFHSWVAEFAKHCESVQVICLFKGEYDLPDNVRVFSLGKEERQSRLQYLIHFYWYVIHERKKYDAVFVHMNQIYIVLAGFLWKMFGKKIGLWYTHRAVHWTLRVATLFTDEIFTASKEGFNLPSQKLHIVGHGINIEQFEKLGEYDHESPSILNVSRITRIKNLDTLVKAVSILVKEGIHMKCTIVGPQVTPDDARYFGELQRLLKEEKIEKNVTFLGGMPNEQVRECYWRHDFNVNLSPTGGIDKVILEGMAAGSIPLASNEAFRPFFGEYADDLMFETRNAEDLARKIKNLIQRKDRPKIIQKLHETVERDFSHKVLIKKILNYLS